MLGNSKQHIKFRIFIKLIVQFFYGRFGTVFFYLFAGFWRDRMANTCIEQPHVVVNFSGRTHGRTRI